MIYRLFRWLFGSASQPALEAGDDEPSRMFTTHAPVKKRAAVAEEIRQRWAAALPRPVTAEGAAMDDLDLSGVKAVSAFAGSSIPDALFSWYGQQNFIGHQMCAILAQHWLINKACTMPARDAIRNGFEISLPDGDDADDATAKLKTKIDKANKRFRLKRHMLDFIRKGRIFGIRVAMFKVDLGSPQETDDFYKNPFNPDAIKQDSYKGIVQVDPYWMIPEFDADAIRDPTALGFYEPTWWLINQRRIHVSHLCIFRGPEPTDLLKPSYLWGGVPVPQMIMERVYAAERTANEAPELAMTKRLTVWHTDFTHIMANQDKFATHLGNMSFYRDNHGYKLIDGDKTAGDKMEQFDTTLTGFNELVMSQYELVAAAANVPAPKLLGTQPKGFNSTGDYEESSYHEELETIQELDLTPLVDRHHLLLARSEFGKDLTIEHDWNPLDSMDAKEEAEVDYVRAQTDDLLQAAGAIDGDDIRERIRADRTSPYRGIKGAAPPPPEMPPKVNPSKPATIKEGPNAVS